MKVPTGWSLDGRFILYQIADPKTLGDIWVLPLFGDQKPFPFLQTNFSEGSAQFSPDGHWIAYVSDDSGKQEVYVQSFPTSGSRWPVSTGGGVEPHWSRDDKEIFYLAPDRKLMAVEVKSESNSFEVGVPKPLFETRIREIQIGLRNNYVLAADGQRFLMTVPAADTAPAPLTVVLNWTAGLKK